MISRIRDLNYRSRASVEINELISLFFPSFLSSRLISAHSLMDRLKIEEEEEEEGDLDRVVADMTGYAEIIIWLASEQK